MALYVEAVQVFKHLKGTLFIPLIRLTVKMRGADRACETNIPPSLRKHSTFPIKSSNLTKQVFFWWIKSPTTGS